MPDTSSIRGRDELARQLVTAIQQLSYARRLETVQAIAAAAGRELAAADGAVLAIRDGDRCRHLDSEALLAGAAGRAYGLADVPAGAAILERRAVVVADTAREPGRAAPFRRELARALVAAPVRAINPLGALCFWWRQPRPAPPGELAWLGALADSAALAVENVRMRRLAVARARERASELAAANLRLEAANLELEAANRRLEEEVAERRRAEEAVRRLSLTDELTGAANRRGFFFLAEGKLETARARNLACAVLFVDLDHLKRVNDEFGHAAGSAMIREAAQLLRRAFGRDAVVGRLGGDEFGVVLTLPSVEPPDRLQERVEAELARLNARGAHPVPVSLSIGAVCEQPGPRRTLDELLAAADRAMYRRKHEVAAPLPRRFRAAVRLAPAGEPAS